MFFPKLGLCYKLKIMKIEYFHSVLFYGMKSVKKLKGTT